MKLTNNKVRHVSENGIEYLEFNCFDEYDDELKAVFAIGGEKKISYSTDVADQNLRNLASIVGVDADKVVWIPDQVHSDLCYKVVSSQDRPSKVDALMTNQRGISLAIRVADCIAALVFDPEHQTIANIHSGWRGTLKRIVPKTIQKMQQEYGSRPESLIIALCPSIGADHFEVQEDVRKMFSDEYGDSRIVKTDAMHYLIDVESCVVDSLVAIGVETSQITRSGICTVCHSDLIHSYRGTKMAQKCLHNAALICMK